MFALSSALVGIVCVAVAATVAPPIPAVPKVLDGAPTPLVIAVEQRIECIREAPSDPQRWTDLGHAYEAVGLTADAAMCYRTSLSLNSRQPRVLYRLALASDESGDLDSATHSMRMAIKLEDSYAPAMARLGHWLLWQGEFDEAEAWMLKARETDPWHTPAWIGQARLCLAQDRPDEAVSFMNEMLSWAIVNEDVGRSLLEAAVRQSGSPDAANLAGQSRFDRVKAEFDWEDPWSSPIIELRTALGLERRSAAELQPDSPRPGGQPRPVPAQKIRVERPSLSRM
jgi:Flp pilus assembly protein TadD